MSIFLVNVGANVSDEPHLRSPILAGRSFKFVPMPEKEFPECSRLSRYMDIEAPLRGDLKPFVSAASLMRRAHNDPEFKTVSYGDYPLTSPRAANLKHVQERVQDRLVFLARLTNWSNGGFTGEAGFYLIGQIEVEKVFKNMQGCPSREVLSEVACNAHVLRALEDGKFWDGFSVFKGNANSGLFKQAVRFDREFVARVGMKTATGTPWVWTGGTELQRIGSYTRSVRMLSGEQATKFIQELESTSVGVDVPS